MMDAVEIQIEERVEQLGFELVDMQKAGSRSRPILRIRIDRLDSSPGSGVTLEDCTRVSRALESVLDRLPEIPIRYVLEVSSPGVERPLVRRRDFERFKGFRVAVHGTSALRGNAKVVEGELLGIKGDADDEKILLRLDDGSDLSIDRNRTKQSHLVYSWGDNRPR